MMNEESGNVGARVALYARVSDDKQVEKDLSIPAQLKAMRDYATRQGWTVHAEFVDEGKTARTDARPQFQQMIGQAKQKERPFTVILVWKLSRFARNREDSIIYKKLLRKHGVDLVSINERIDDSPSGRLLEGIIEVIDEFYSANLASDTIRGMKENTRRGFLNGSIPPFGYKRVRVKDGSAERSKLEIEEAEAPLVRRLFKLCLEGKGAKEIARTLNNEGIKTRRGRTWEVNGVRYILQNETYTGTLVFNRVQKHPLAEGKKFGEHTVRTENAHAAIIERETFEAAKAAMAARSPKFVHPRTVSSSYLLSGFTFCVCGAALGGQASKHSKFFYYGCHNRMRRGDHGCKSKLVRKEKLEGAVIALLKKRILTEAHLTDLVGQVNAAINQKRGGIDKQIDALEAQEAVIKTRLDKLYVALESGKVDLDDLAPRIKDCRSQIEDIKRRRIDLEIAAAIKPVRITSPEVRRHVEDLHAVLSGGSVFDRKGFLRSFVKKIVVDGTKGTIEYALPLVPAQKQSGHPEGDSRSTREVLAIGQSGVPEGM